MYFFRNETPGSRIAKEQRYVYKPTGFTFLNSVKHLLRSKEGVQTGSSLWQFYNVIRH